MSRYSDLKIERKNALAYNEQYFTKIKDGLSLLVDTLRSYIGISATQLFIVKDEEKNSLIRNMETNSKTGLVEGILFFIYEPETPEQINYVFRFGIKTIGDEYSISFQWDKKFMVFSFSHSDTTGMWDIGDYILDCVKQDFWSVKNVLETNQ